jgi:hypothetical protein
VHAAAMDADPGAEAARLDTRVRLAIFASWASAVVRLSETPTFLRCVRHLDIVGKGLPPYG